MKQEHDENCPASHDVMTNMDHEAVCAMKMEPINVKIGHLKEGQDRVEEKMTSVEKKVDSLGVSFQDLKLLIIRNINKKEGG